MQYACFLFFFVQGFLLCACPGFLFTYLLHRVSCSAVVQGFLINYVIVVLLNSCGGISHWYVVMCCCAGFPNFCRSGLPKPGYRQLPVGQDVLVLLSWFKLLQVKHYQQQVGRYSKLEGASSWKVQQVGIFSKLEGTAGWKVQQVGRYSKLEGTTS